MLILAAGENRLYQTLKGKGLGDGSAMGRTYFARRVQRTHIWFPASLLGCSQSPLLQAPEDKCPLLTQAKVT